VNFRTRAGAKDPDSFLAGRDFSVGATARNQLLGPWMEDPGRVIAAIVNVESHNIAAEQGERNAVYTTLCIGSHGGFEAAPGRRIVAACMGGRPISTV
jgi:hypothetical protein